jgi:TolB-like protein/Tfp pilus assembly protein PilF
MSPDPGDEYFADGLTEELIERLCHVRELEVIARTSVMSYKKKEKKAAEIARELNAGSIVEGSVRKAGNKIRVTAQLVNGATEGHLWSSTYDRNIDDIFAVQSEIAQQVTDALRIQLLVNEKEAIEKKATESIGAYTLYLKGRYHWNERTKDGNNRAAKYFEKALELDSSFALAYSGLADCYSTAGVYGWLKPNEAFPKEKECAMKAIGIDSGIAEAHASLAGVFEMFEWRGKEAEREYRRAIELKPGYALAHHWYSIFLTARGNMSEAYDEARRAMDLDPLSAVMGQDIGEKLLYMGKTGEAIDQLKRVIEANPDFSWAHASLGFAYLLVSKTSDAIEESRKAVSISGGDSLTKAYLACVLGFAGLRDAAGKILRELDELSGYSPFLNGYIASILFSIGRTDKAFEYLGRAFDERAVSTDLWNFFWLSLFNRFRTDQRWTTFERRRGLL